MSAFRFANHEPDNLIDHLMQGCVMCRRAAVLLSEPRYLMLNCHCGAPMAIRIDTIDHGLIAGWKCDRCQGTYKLSELAASSEYIATKNDPSFAVPVKQDTDTAPDRCPTCRLLRYDMRDGQRVCGCTDQSGPRT